MSELFTALIAIQIRPATKRILDSIDDLATKMGPGYANLFGGFNERQFDNTKSGGTLPPLHR